jgi:bifunctional DNase/RNase
MNVNAGNGKKMFAIKEMINVDAKNKAMAMKEVNMLRPLTHDGLIRLIEAFGNSVIITSIQSLAQSKLIKPIKFFQF